MSQKRSNLIDIIKGLMIIFILITHFNFIYPDDYKKYGFFFYIDMAVPVFMIITGYLHAIQFRKEDIRSFSQAMSPTIIIPKILRFFVPYSLIMLVEIPILFKVYDYGILDLFNTVICGGIGPGSYYTPAMIQIVFILPIVYFIIKRYDFFGTILCFIFTAFWELLQYSWGMSDSIYRLVAFRYVSVIAWGTFIAIGKVQLKRIVLIVMFFIGIIFQISLNYLSFNPVFMNYGWARVNYIASLFIMPIIYFILKNYNNCNMNFLVFQEIGKASFNIFLTQMIFYGLGPVNYLYSNIQTIWIQLFICILINTVVGYIFYRIEKIITYYIISFFKEHNYGLSIFHHTLSICNYYANRKKRGHLNE